MVSERIAGSAQAFSWAGRYMQTALQPLLQLGPTTEINAYGGDQREIMIAGATGSTIMLWAFAAELALKALIVQEKDGDPPRKHDLSALFNALSPSTQESLERRYHDIRSAQSAYRGLPVTLREILADHSTDFEDWRYLYERTDGAKTQILGLRPATEAMLEQHASNLLMRERSTKHNPLP